jgi:hypothetical protein
MGYSLNNPLKMAKEIRTAVAHNSMGRPNTNPRECAISAITSAAAQATPEKILILGIGIRFGLGRKKTRWKHTAKNSGHAILSDKELFMGVLGSISRNDYDQMLFIASYMISTIFSC